MRLNHLRAKAWFQRTYSEAPERSVPKMGRSGSARTVRASTIIAQKGRRGARSDVTQPVWKNTGAFLAVRPLRLPRGGFKDPGVLPPVTTAMGVGEVNSCRFIGTAMRILHFREVEIGPNDRVFRHSRVLALIVWLGGLASAIAFLVHRVHGKMAARILLRPVFAAFSALTLRMVTARFILPISGSDDRDRYVCAISFLSQLPIVPDDLSLAFLSSARSRRPG